MCVVHVHLCVCVYVCVCVCVCVHVCGDSLCCPLLTDISTACADRGWDHLLCDNLSQHVEGPQCDLHVHERLIRKVGQRGGER